MSFGGEILHGRRKTGARVLKMLQHIIEHDAVESLLNIGETAPKIEADHPIQNLLRFLERDVIAVNAHDANELLLPRLFDQSAKGSRSTTYIKNTVYASWE